MGPNRWHGPRIVSLEKIAGREFCPFFFFQFGFGVYFLPGGAFSPFSKGGGGGGGEEKKKTQFWRKKSGGASNGAFAFLFPIFLNFNFFRGGQNLFFQIVTVGGGNPPPQFFLAFLLKTVIYIFEWLECSYKAGRPYLGGKQLYKIFLF